MKALFAVKNTNKNTNKTFPILNYALYAGEKLVATDLEVQVEIDYKISGLQENTLLPIKWFKAIYGTGKAPLVYADGKINGQQIPAHELESEDFPTLKAASGFSPSASVLASAGELRGVAKAAACHDIRYYINGVLLDFKNKRIAATDGHRLHVASGLVVAGEGECIIPRDAVCVALACAGKGDVTIEFDEKLSLVRTQFKGTTIFSRVIEGKFPDIDKVTPALKDRAGGMISVGPGGIDEIKDYISVSKTWPDRPAVCSGVFVGGEIRRGDMSMAMQQVRSKGEEFGVQVDFIVDALEFVGSREVHLLDSMSSGMVVSGNRTAVVMPMRI